MLSKKFFIHNKFYTILSNIELDLAGSHCNLLFAHNNSAAPDPPQWPSPRAFHSASILSTKKANTNNEDLDASIIISGGMSYGQGYVIFLACGLNDIWKWSIKQKQWTLIRQNNDTVCPSQPVKPKSSGGSG